MNYPTIVGVGVVICTFGGALLGMWFRTALRKNHLDVDSKDLVKIAIGLVAMMTALVLGLVLATAKRSYDLVDSTVRTASIELLALDRVLARYGRETDAIRQSLQRGVATRIDLIGRRTHPAPPLWIRSARQPRCARASRTPSTCSSRATTPSARSRPGTAPRRGAAGIAVGRVRGRGRSRSSALPGDSRLLAHVHLRELRAACTAPRHGARGPLPVCAVRR